MKNSNLYKLDTQELATILQALRWYAATAKERDRAAGKVAGTQENALTAAELEQLCQNLAAADSRPLLEHLQDVVTAWPEFDTDEAVSGADLTDWFAGFRVTVKASLAQISALPQPFVIMSKSERGYWSNEEGWIFEPQNATVFWDNAGPLPPVPLSSANDARYVLQDGTLKAFEDDLEEGLQQVAHRALRPS